MPILVTPGQFSRRSAFYHQLSQTTSVGLPITRALEQLERNPPSPLYRKPLRNALDHLARGFTLTESFRAGKWLPVLDQALLQAGEQSGTLPACFRQLSEHYQSRAKITRNTLFAVAYPLFIVHFAAMIFPLDRLTGLVLHGQIWAFFWQKFTILAPFWGLVIFFVLTSQWEASAWRAWVERVLHVVPLLGRARRSLAIARLSSALGALINAGMSIVEAWELAAEASASPVLQRVVRAAKPQLVAGTTPAEMVRASREFPSVFADLYETGEVSGKLDESLERARSYFQEEGSRKLTQFIVVCCVILMITVVLVVAWQIIQFYVGYFQQLNNATQGF